MDLNALVSKINEKYPNSSGLATSSLVNEADRLQKRIFRKLKRETYSSYDLVTDQPTYPISMKTTDIFQVDIGNSTTSKFCKYPLRKVSDSINSCTKYHYFINDIDVGLWIGIYPLPTDTEDTMVIYYYEIPETLDVSFLEGTPMLDENYHMMLVYGVCAEVAESFRDTDMAAGFAMQYNALESELLGLTKSSDSYTVQNKMRW